MQQQLENTLIKNYIDELKFLRVENYELSTKLTASEDECKVLQNRLKSVKDKYTISKQERNKAWVRVKELDQSN